MNPGKGGFCRIGVPDLSVRLIYRLGLNEQEKILNFSGMRFPKEIILACIRWNAAYALSYSSALLGRG